MKIAIVDVGTNTTRLFVADVVDGAVEETLLRTGRVTRLGAGVDASGLLSDAALGREHAALADLSDQIADLRVDRAVAVMTSAVRDASNGAEFAADVTARYGLETHILTGDQEAALTYRGATDAFDRDSRERILVVDIGGGSTELVLGHGITSDFHVSTQAGVVRQSDRHITHDPPTAAEIRALSGDVAATLAAGVPTGRRHGVERTLAVAGTPTSLAAMDLALEPYDPERVHGYLLSRATLARLYDEVRDMPLAQRREITGLHPDRATVIIPGAVILAAVMDLFGLEQIEVSEHDILLGAALHFTAVA